MLCVLAPPTDLGEAPGGYMGQRKGAMGTAEDGEGLQHRQPTHGQAQEEERPVDASLGSGHGVPGEALIVG